MKQGKRRRHKDRGDKARNEEISQGKTGKVKERGDHARTEKKV